jgi:cell division protein FtsL
MPERAIADALTRIDGYMVEVHGVRDDLHEIREAQENDRKWFKVAVAIGAGFAVLAVVALVAIWVTFDQRDQANEKERARLEVQEAREDWNRCIQTNEARKSIREAFDLALQALGDRATNPHLPTTQERIEVLRRTVAERLETLEIVDCGPRPT